MSKFILSNLKAVDKTVSKSERVGFSISGKMDSSDFFFFRAFHKLGMKNENFLRFNDDFISVVGTCIYKNCMGIEALSAIYDDFNGLNAIESIRESFIGNCAFIIKKAGKVYVFGDNYALYGIYYYINDSEYVICNNLMDIANTVLVEPNWNNIYERIWFSTIYCGGTYFNNVYRLSDDKCLVIDCVSNTVNITNIDIKWVSNKSLSYESIVDVVSKSLVANAKLVANSLDTPVLSSTGGLDNRMNLASFLASGTKPILYYGIGNSTLTYTFNEDAEIDRIYSAKYDLLFNTMNWATPDPINMDWKKLLEMFGDSYELYAGSDAIFNGYMSIESKSIFFGYFGEMYRNLDFINNLKSDTFSINEYLDNYLMLMTDPKEIIIDDKESFKQYVREHLLKICEKWKLNPDRISIEDEIYLSLERRLVSDTRFVNWINYHHYSFFLLAQKNILQYVLKVKSDKKKNSRFMIDLLLQIQPSIMEVPVFTHTHYMVYDEDSRQLKLPAERRLKNWLQSIIPFYDSIIGSFLGKKAKAILKNKKKKEEVVHDKASRGLIDSLMTKHGLIKGRDYGGQSSITGSIDRTIAYLQILEELDDAKPL